MANEAGVKITLDNAQFLTEIKRVGDQVDAAGKRGQKSFDLFGRAAESTKKSLATLGGKIRDAGKLALTFGGAFTLGAALRNTVQLNASYETLAYRIETATGELMKAADVQELIERAAAKTSRSSAEMRDAFETVFGATKDLAYTRDMLESIGTTALATGDSIDNIANITHSLQRKFGLDAGRAREALAKIFEQAQQGGPSFEGFAATIDLVGAELLQAGLRGERALNFLLGALNKSDAEFGNLGKQVGGIQAMLAKLGAAPVLKTLAEKIGISGKDLIDDEDALARLKRILSTGEKGLAALKATFIGPDEAKAMRVLFTAPFEDALKRARDGGLKGKEATEQALRWLEAELASFGKATRSFADLQERAAERAAEPQAQLARAMETLNQAFARPEIIAAITDLAQHLPKLASIFSRFVSFAAKNPILAGTLGVGGFTAKNFISELATEIMKAHIVGAGMGAARTKTAITEGAASAGLTLTGALGEKMTIPVKRSFAQAARAAVPILATAGPMIGSAALAAFAIGKEQIDKAYSEESRVQSEAVAASAGARNTGSLASRKKSLARASSSLQAQRAAFESGNAGNGFVDIMARAFLKIGEKLGINDAAPDTREMAYEQIEATERQVAELQASIRELEAEEKRRQAEPAPAAAASADKPAAAGGRPRPVALDSAAPRAIAVATATALGGMVLDVRVVPGSPAPGGRGAGGSRGPLPAAPARSGGGV